MKPLAQGSGEASNQALLGTGDDLDDGRPDDNEEEDRQHHRADLKGALSFLLEPLFALPYACTPFFSCWADLREVLRDSGILAKKVPWVEGGQLL
eukprot:CAMPEP_0115072994 /NCGR_PEP_ID=MMETSP0227-20121206/14546_1 /TAXON_ID=89957 /ORGANISM="Polarella glacialis, Strain CCMP 1383" /LENGTH=94 /DNA_ID=CAMNT_0002459817 /DNA_START=197 /DNA_END=482 /DNA_ORIENTATION=+